MWKDNFKMYELTIIMRQKEYFAELLNRLREGHHTVDDINILKQHVKEENNQSQAFPICLQQEKKYRCTTQWCIMKQKETRKSA